MGLPLGHLCSGAEARSLWRHNQRAVRLDGRLLLARKVKSYRPLAGRASQSALLMNWPPSERRWPAEVGWHH